MSSSPARLAHRTGLSLLMFALSATWARADPVFTVKSVGETLSTHGIEYNAIGNLYHGPLFDAKQPGGVTVGSGISPYSGPLPPGLHGSPGQAEIGGKAGNNVAGWALGADDPHVAAPPTIAFANLGGQLENLGVLPGTQGINPGSQAFGVNQPGQVVGISFSGPNTHWNTQPFLYTASQGMSPIATPSGANGQALGINDAGLIVGTYATGLGAHGFVDAGQLIASGFDGEAAHGFISNNGGPVADLNHLMDPSLGWTITRAGAIDSAGDIAAIGYDSSGTLHVLRLGPVSGLSLQQLTDAIDKQGAIDFATPLPVPEPSTLAVLVAGASLWAWRPRQGAASSQAS